MEQGKRGDHFKQALVEQLKAVVGDRQAAAAVENEQRRRPIWRHGGRLVLGIAVVVAGALAAVLIVGGGRDSTSKAFAVEHQQGGGVTIKVYSLKDAPDLETALEDAGIRA